MNDEYQMRQFFEPNDPKFAMETDGTRTVKVEIEDVTDYNSLKGKAVISTVKTIDNKKYRHYELDLSKQEPIKTEFSRTIFIKSTPNNNRL